MTQIEFLYKGNTLIIQGEGKETMKELINKFLSKIDESKDKLVFLYGGKKIEENLTFAQQANDFDKSLNKMNIIVLDYKETEKIIIQKKSKNIICPECNQNIRIKINKQKISLYDCRNGHKKDFNTIEELEKTQYIDESKIICDNCKKQNKYNSYENKFFICCNCKINLCPLCKTTKHDKSHDFIDYDIKNYYCDIHYDINNLYCNDCKKDICSICEKNHYGHKLITYGSIMPDKNIINNELEYMKKNIEEVKIDISYIIEKLKNYLNKLDNYYKISYYIIKNYKGKNKNYSELQNINDIFDFMQNFNKNIFEMEIKNKFDNLINLFPYNEKLNIENNDNYINNSSIKSKQEIINNNVIDIKILDEFKIFLNDVDPNNNLSSCKLSLQVLKENITNRKIRISFIGDIGVGKSSILNGIIGENILPTGFECTNRGIIIRHSFEKDAKFKLYKTKLIIKEEGYQYCYFKDDNNAICIGSNNIKNFLNIQNNDNNIKDDNIFFVIIGYLKIFDFIKLNEEIIKKIEFIDLPGQDRRNISLNEKKYYEKILSFSNCFIFVNDIQTIEDKNSLENLSYWYLRYKHKIFPTVNKNFIKNCIFLINKSDMVRSDFIGNIKQTFENILIKIISKIENNIQKNDINISFFSGKLFLHVIYYYIYLLENDPYSLINNLYNEYRTSNINLEESFISYINEKLEEINNIFSLNELIDNKPSQDFLINIKYAIKHFENKNQIVLIDPKDYNEVSQSLYNITQKLKSNYFSEFFEDIKKIIINSEKLNAENFKNQLSSYFKCTDILFNNREEWEEFKIRYNEQKKKILNKIEGI